MKKNPARLPCRWLLPLLFALALTLLFALPALATEAQEPEITQAEDGYLEMRVRREKDVEPYYQALAERVKGQDVKLRFKMVQNGPNNYFDEEVRCARTLLEKLPYRTLALDIPVLSGQEEDSFIKNREGLNELAVSVLAMDYDFRRYITDIYPEVKKLTIYDLGEEARSINYWFHDLDVEKQDCLNDFFPNVETLTLQFKNEDVEMLENLDTEEIDSIPHLKALNLTVRGKPSFPANLKLRCLLARLITYNPALLVNGETLTADMLKEGLEEEDARTIEWMCACGQVLELLDGAKEGTLKKEQRKQAFGRKLLFYFGGWTPHKRCSLQETDEQVYEGLDPERLAASIRDADTLVLIYPVYVDVGYYMVPFYTSARECTTKLTAVDLAKQVITLDMKISVEQPPRETSSYGPFSGEFKDSEALEKVIKRINGLPVPTPAPVKSDPDPETLGFLSDLGEPLYQKTYDYLLSGNVIAKGERSDFGRGLQTLLVALGQDIAVDGQVGGKTMAALNAVQEALGQEKSDFLDVHGFEALIKSLAGKAPAA